MDISCRFNEAGVKLYQQGRESEAFDLFHASLEVLMLTQGRTTAFLDSFQCQSLALHAAVAQALNMDLNNERNFPAKDCEVLPFSTHTVDSLEVTGHTMCTLTDHTLPRNTSPQVHRLSRTDDPCLFDKIFAWKAPACPVYEQYIVYIAMELYNIALILQKGQMNHRMSNCLERALMLYSIAGDLLWKNLGTALVRPNNWGVPLSMLYCATLNNNGYLMHQMGRFDWAQLFFFRLNTALETIGPAESIAEQHDRDALQLNVIVLYGRSTTAASA